MKVDYFDGKICLDGKKTQKGLIYKIYLYVDDNANVIYSLASKIKEKRKNNEPIILAFCNESEEHLFSLNTEKVADLALLLKSKIFGSVITVLSEQSKVVSMLPFNEKGSRSGTFVVAC